jgi:PAS domain S-box-containing protein
MTWQFRRTRPARILHAEPSSAVPLVWWEPMTLKSPNQNERLGRDDALALLSQLERSDHLYRLLVESVADYAIFVLDATGHIRSWNPGAQRLKGYTADEIVGKHFSTFYPEADIVARKPEKLLEIASRVGRVEDEGWRVRKDGTQFWANVVITALHDDNGGLIGFAKITRDLTERRNAEEQARSLVAERAARKEAEAYSQQLLHLSDQLQQQALELEAQTEEAQSLTEELEQANEELQQQAVEAETARAEADAANRAKTEFLAVMSHELRTPLNAIAGYAELLRMGIRGPVTAEQLEDLERIARSERTLLALVNDVLNYARMEAGQVDYADERVVVAALLADMETLVSPQLKAKNLQFTVGSCDPELAVRADGDKVQQILVNLMSNAVKFTAPGGSVEVTCEGNATHVRIRARDTGIGIPPDKVQAIFEPFVQLDRSLTSTKEGSGLGLAISRDLARAMGGDLVVESTVGRGSTFILTLPRDRGSSGAK